MAYDQNAVNQIFQSSLGRAGTQAEHDFLSPYVTSGTISPYQIGQYLQSTPEAMSSRNNAQQNQYAGMLTQNNSQILGQAADAANASFEQNGRQFSSGQGNAVIQAGQQLAAQQSPMIAQNAQNNYQALSANYAGQGQDAMSRAYDLTDSATAYGRDLTMYNRQSNDYQNLLRQQGTRGLQQGLIGIGGQVAGGLLGGAALGAFSDSRLKENVSAVGKIGPLTVYEFNYKQGTGLDLPAGRRTGFMANEVEVVHPEAVTVDRGFKKVDYGYLRGVL